MSGSIYGKNFCISTWGESHGKAIGVVVDGCPSGLELDEEDIQAFLDRRKPGQSRFATQRNESDKVEILSGIFDGKTTGAPISLLVKNQDQHSNDYENIASVYRPGHADFTWTQKYGFRDYRGGGRSSGRETIGRVAGGAIAVKILATLGVSIQSYSRKIGEIEISDERFDFNESKKNPFALPDVQIIEKVEQYVQKQMEHQDSVGGIIECKVLSLPVGIGEPVFDKLDANLAKAMLSIGAVKGFEMGDGFASANLKGSEHNDAFRLGKQQAIIKTSNHAGGVLGGISDGSDLVFRVAIKPTASIAQVQSSVNQNNEEVDIQIQGRHDPIIVPRAVVVVESMAALTILDLLLQSMSSRLDKIQKFFHTT
ncbi:chorismate synthase [Clostridia bacterium]|nr:chorismate synthase [Clostridia bacterium]